jgi:hypothetical protein
MFWSNTTWTWWDIFFLMFIWIPLATVWFMAIFDVFRQRALSGIAKALWLLAIVIFPLIGTLAYLIFRPSEEPYYGATATGYYAPPTSARSAPTAPTK